MDEMVYVVTIYTRYDDIKETHYMVDEVFKDEEKAYEYVVRKNIKFIMEDVCNYRWDEDIHMQDIVNIKSDNKTINTLIELMVRENKWYDKYEELEFLKEDIQMNNVTWYEVSEKYIKL